MTDGARPSSLLNLSELVIQKSTRDHFFSEVAVAAPDGAPLGHAQLAGNKALLLLNTFSDGWLFPSRPREVRDRDGQPVLWIEISRILRRMVITVRWPDRSLVGRLVGQTWATTLRNKGFWVEVDGVRVGEVLADKDEYRIVDSAGVEVASAHKRRGQPSYDLGLAHTTLRARPSLPEHLAGLTLATTILRHLV